LRETLDDRPEIPRQIFPKIPNKFFLGRELLRTIRDLQPLTYIPKVKEIFGFASSLQTGQFVFIELIQSGNLTQYLDDGGRRTEKFQFPFVIFRFSLRDLDLDPE
jgi:hypothetical protein